MSAFPQLLRLGLPALLAIALACPPFRPPEPPPMPPPESGREESALKPAYDVLALSKVTLEDAPVRGNAESPVVVVEFSDLQCPYCGRLHEIVKREIYPSYSDRVAFRFKHVPIPTHNWARYGAMASMCAGEQDRFWEAVDWIFEHARDISFESFPRQIVLMSDELGLEPEPFIVCFEESRYRGYVRRDFQQALDAGVRATPTLVIDGRAYAGLVSAEVIAAELDRALAEKNPALAAEASPAE